MMKTIERYIKLQVVAAIICIASALPGYGQCEIDKLLASDGVFDDALGFSAAISGNVAIVGAPHDGENGFWSGSAYIYRMDPETLMWEEEAKLLAFDGETQDIYGWSVDIHNDVAVVGAYSDRHNGVLTGSVYVYRFDPKTEIWEIETKLPASDGDIADWFGFSVAIDGEMILIGAPAEDENGLNAGSVYAFRFNSGTSTWIEEDKFIASKGLENKFFGDSLALDGNLAIIGEFGNGDNGTGAAYIFRLNSDEKTWIEEAKLLDPDGSPFDNFGKQVDIFSDLAIAGSHQDDDNGASSGSTFIFRFDPSAESGSKWFLEAKLLPSDGDSFDAFGRGVAIGNNVALVGAPGQDGNTLNSGATYIYHFDPNLSQWLEASQFLAWDVVESQGFGGEIALENNFAVIGAPGDDDNGINTGASYIFAGFSDTDCNGNGEADICDIFDGQSNDQNNNSVPDECDADLDGNGNVGTNDLLILLSNWGPCNECASDLDGDGFVTTSDLLILLGNWGVQL